MIFLKNSNLNESLTASDNLKFRFATDGEGNYGYLGADDSFIPFKRGFVPETAQRVYTYDYVKSLSITPEFTGKALLFVTSNSNNYSVAHSLGSGLNNEKQLIGTYGSTGNVNALWIGDAVSGVPIEVTTNAPSSVFTINLVQIGE